MNDELILPEADAPIVPVADSPDHSQPHSRKTILLGTIIAIVVIALATVLIIIVNKSPANPDDSPETSESDPSAFYYDANEFTAAMERAYESLYDFNDYESAEYYLQPYSATERMTAAQRYRFFSFYTEMYSEEYLDRPELVQKYSALADSALKSIREGAS